MSTSHQWLFEVPLTFTFRDSFADGQTISNLLLANAANDARLNRPGVYRITWIDRKGASHVYDGKATNVRRRLKEHLGCLTSLIGGDSHRHRVHVQLMALTKGGKPQKGKKVKQALEKAEKRRIEQSWGRRDAGKVISTNKRLGEFTL